MSRIRTVIKPRLPLAALTLVALGSSLAVALGSAPESDAYWVCSPTTAVVRGPDFRCQSGGFNGALSYVEKNSSPRAYGVYRSTTPGGSAVGDEYFSGSTDYYLQDYGCAAGYPNAHNRNTVNNTVQFTLAGTC